MVKWLSFVLLVVPAVIRTCVLISPNQYFATDPRVMATIPDGLGPAGSIFLDLLSLVGMVLALWAQRRSGRGLNIVVCALAFVPAAVIAWHGPDSLGNLRVGSHWLAAVATAVGAFHLARDRRLRILMAAAFAALIVPMSIKGLYQVLVEHPVTVQDFEQYAPTVFASHGWDPDSPSARLFRRRLEQAEVSGWFVTANVYGTVLLGLAALWAATLLSAARARISSGWVGLLGLIAAAGVAGVILSFSKGAIALCVIGIGLVAITLLPYRRKRTVLRRAAVAGLVIVTLVPVLTALRGALLGEDFAADGYSLLFRWQYWVGAARSWLDAPLLGVGPDGFRAAFFIHKPPLSPEEVVAPHNVFIAWIVALGLLGIGWITLIIRMLYAATPRRSDTADAAIDADPPNPESGSAQPVGKERNADDQFPHAVGRRAAWLSATSVGLLGLGIAWWLNFPTMMFDLKWIFWPMAMIGYIALMAGVSSIVGHPRINEGWWWGIWAALVVMLAHAQIEISLTQPGAASLILLLLGAAAGRLPTDQIQRQHSRPGRIRVAQSLAMLGALLMTVTHGALAWWPVQREQHGLARAALILTPVGEASRLLAASGSSPDLPALLGALDNVAGIIGDVDPALVSQATVLLGEARSAWYAQDSQKLQASVREALEQLADARTQLELNAIQQALGSLNSADNASWRLTESARLPNDVVPLTERAKLWQTLARIHASRQQTADRDAAYRQACAIAEEIIKRQPGRAATYFFAARLYHERAQALSQEPGASDDDALPLIARTIQLQQRACDLEPYGLSSAQRLALYHLEAGHRLEAARAYRRVLEIDDWLRLDPLKGLGDRRSEIERTLRSLEAEIEAEAKTRSPAPEDQ